jgi:hypothetical protein
MAQNLLCIQAVVPEVHKQGLEMSPQGLNLSPHLPAEALTGLDDQLGPFPKGESVCTSCIHTLGQTLT